MYPLATMKFISFILLLSVFLFACSAKRQEYQERDQPPRYLSIQGDVSPEGLLLRAHEFDTDATAKVVLGYLWGRDGLPRDPALAEQWAFQSYYMWDIHNAALLNGIVYYEIYHDMRSAVVRACLEFSKNSPLARRLSDTEIFDVDKCLMGLPLPDAEDREWIDKFKASLRRYQNFSIQCAEVMRRLLNEKATHKEMALLAEKNTMYITALSKLAALLERDGSTLDIDLMRLVVAQQGGKDAWRYSGEDLLWQRLLLDTQSVLNLFRKAHQGDSLAMRQMALNYEQGSAGFPISPGLAHAWRNRCAYAGDAACQLTQAFPALKEEQSDASSWAWATLAKEGGDARVQGMAGWILQRIESRIADEDMARGRELLQEYREKIRLNLASHGALAH